MRRGFVIRSVHRVHRWLGTVLGSLVAIWFASGAVMLFTGYPYFEPAERVALAPELALPGRLSTPAEIGQWLEGPAALSGGRARLSMLEARPTWTFGDGSGGRRALGESGEPIQWLDEARARAEIARRFGQRITRMSQLDQADQWTLSRANRELFPLWLGELDDVAHTQVYLSARTGELAQVTTRAERIGAWLGAIPHWIYPAILVRHREVWSWSVIVLALIGLALSLAGLAAGLHSWLLSRRRTGARARNVYLQWHQRIGLVFGVFASSWLLSGALSLEPFDWTGPGPTEAAIASLHGRPSELAASLQQLPAAVQRCQQLRSLREIELFTFGQRLYVSCVGASETRSVDVLEPKQELRQLVAPAQIERVAKRLSADRRYELQWSERADDFYYPTHGATDFALPYVRVTMHDQQASTYYLDPRSPQLLRFTTQRKRLERWLYNGLHSWDFAWLYRWPVVWRALLVIAMLSGLSLSVLGLLLPITRSLRRHEPGPEGRKPGRSANV